MLISTKDKLAFKMLLNIQSGNYYPAEFDFDISQSDFYNLLNEFIDNNFVIGYTLVKGQGYTAVQPRVTAGGLSVIEIYLLNNLLLDLVHKTQSQGFSNTYFTKDQIENILDVPTSQILFLLELFENNNYITIDSKRYADNELYFYTIKLTPIGYNQYSNNPIFKEPSKDSFVHINNSVNNNFSNSTVIQGNITNNDSFNNIVNASGINLSTEQKNELKELISSLINEKKISNESETKIIDYFRKMAGKAGETVVSQSVIALIKAIFS